MIKTLRVTITLTRDEWDALTKLTGADPLAIAETVPQLVQHVATCAAAGVRRPGSWERAWIEQATGCDLR